MKRCARDNVFKTINVMLDYKIETRKKVFKAILPSDKLAEVMNYFYRLPLGKKPVRERQAHFCFFWW